MTSTTVTLKYLKEAQYESKLFKVCEFNLNDIIIMTAIIRFNVFMLLKKIH